MSKTLTLPAGVLIDYPSRSEWLNVRKSGVGGSDMASVMGLQSFSSALEVYYSKVDEVPEREVPEHVTWGSRLEPFILREWAEDVGLSDYVQAYDFAIIRHSALHYMLHSPDALILDVDGNAIEGVEIKNIRSEQHWSGEYGMPERVYAQVQHGLFCSGLPLWTVVALVGGNKLITREVAPDQRFIGDMTLAADKFWNDHVLKNVPPEPSGTEADERALRAAWDSSFGSAAIKEELWHDLLDAKALLDFHTERFDAVKQRVQLAMADAEYATVDGVSVASWKVSTRNTMDTARLRKELPDVAAKYNKVAPSRTFRVL
jgi:putative phage-type endonuclease